MTLSPEDIRAFVADSTDPVVDKEGCNEWGREGIVHNKSVSRRNSAGCVASVFLASVFLASKYNQLVYDRVLLYSLDT
jgi:hypothetical protein